MSSVSVVVPAFNAASSIGACVRSLKDLEPAAEEIIVVDDASTDATAEVAEAAGARVVRLKRNGGPGVARNEGAAVARGEYLAFIDADCIAQRDWLGNHFAAADDERWCATTGPYSGAASDALIPELMDLCLRFQQRDMPESIWAAISSNLVVRRSDFLAVGGFPEYRLPGARAPYWGNEDQELAHLLIAHTGKPVRWVPEGGPLHEYRSTLRGYLAQQKRYAEAVLVSSFRFPGMSREKANYSKSSTMGRLLSTWLALPALAAPPLAFFALPFLAVHAPAVAFVASQRPRLSYVAAAYPFLFLTSLAWTAGLTTGAAKGLAGVVAWRRLAAAR